MFTLAESQKSVYDSARERFQQITTAVWDSQMLQVLKVHTRYIKVDFTFIFTEHQRQVARAWQMAKLF